MEHKPEKYTEFITTPLPELSGKDEITITIPDVHLDNIKKVSEKVPFIVEKMPKEIIKGETYHGTVFIDSNTPKMNILEEEAIKLQNVPEQEKVKHLINIVHDNLLFSYPWVLEELKSKDKELAEWINTNTSIRAIGVIPLSELIEKGYGICRHFSVFFLWLAKRAGLEGVILYGEVKNIRREDTKKPLFKLTDLGNTLPHTWVELKMTNGEWLPVDPTTKLIGDSEKKLQIFKDAHYLGILKSSIESKTTGEQGKLSLELDIPLFNPGDSYALGRAGVKLIRRLTLDNNKKKNINPLNIVTPTPYHGNVSIVLSQDKYFNDGKIKFHLFNEN